MARDIREDSGRDYLPGTQFVYDPETKTVNVKEPRVIEDRFEDPSDPRTGTAATTSGLPDADYASWLGLFGLPADVQKKINEIFSNSTDVNQATQLSLAYVRGTSWYTQTYPGIKEGFAKGIVANEAQYRELLNQQNQLYRQYFGRDIAGSEFAAHLAEGTNTDTLGRRFSGAAYVKANASDIQYLGGAFGEGRLSDSELKAFGEEKAGIDTPLGQLMDQRLSKAKERMQAVFSGQLATPSFGLRGGRLTATSLGGDDSPDVGR